MVGIGPDGTGRFHPTAIAQLEEVGAWLRVNGAGIFNTHARAGDAWKAGDDVRFTAADDGRHLYAFLLKRPEGSVEVANVRAKAGTKIYLLGHDAPLTWRPASNGITVDFPASAKPSLAYVLKMESS